MYVLSKEELMDYLYSLRKTLIKIDYKLLSNIIFINQEALYSHYAQLKCITSYGCELTINELMETIEPYIPFALTQATLDYFIAASLAVTEDEMSELEKKFNISAKLDFINVIRNIIFEEDWSYLLAVCENLRQNKNYAMQYVK